MTKEHVIWGQNVGSLKGDHGEVCLRPLHPAEASESQGSRVRRGHREGPWPRSPSPDKKPRLVASARDSMSARRSGRHFARCHPGLWVQQDNIRSNMETPTKSTPPGGVRSYTDKAFHKVANTRNVPTEASLKK